MEGAPPVANQIDLFMHFLGASRDGLVARPVEMDKISSSVFSLLYFENLGNRYAQFKSPSSLSHFPLIYHRY